MKKSDFFKNLAGGYANAIQGRDEHLEQILIGDFYVNLHFAGPELMPIFYNAFRHLSTDGIKGEDLSIFFWHGTEDRLTNSNVPWDLEDRHHLGFIESFSDDQYFTLHQPGSNAIYMFDSKSSSAYFWVREVSLIPHWESDFPLRMIFHWWLKDTGFQPVHAAAVGTEMGGVLMVGKGGSGKSTSALKCVNSELKLAGDDYVLLDCNKKNVYSLFSLTKADKNSLSLLPQLGLDSEKLPKPIDDKYRIMLYPSFKSSLILKMPVVAMLLPRITQSPKTKIVPCSAGEAMTALAPTTLFQLPGLRQEAFKKMANFSKSIKTFHLDIGSDSYRLPQILGKFIDEQIERQVAIK